MISLRFIPHPKLREVNYKKIDKWRPWKIWHKRMHAKKRVIAKDLRQHEKNCMGEKREKVHVWDLSINWSNRWALINKNSQKVQTEGEGIYSQQWSTQVIKRRKPSSTTFCMCTYLKYAQPKIIWWVSAQIHLIIWFGLIAN